MKHLEIDFSKLVVGQKVWSILHGELVIANLEKTNRYPITTVDTDKNEKIFTIDGKYHLNHIYPALYLSNPFEQINEYPKLMEVSDDSINWYKRIVIAKNNSYFVSWNRNPTTDRPAYWTYAREIQKPKIQELTLKDIADKFGISVDSIRIKE